jgi:hypothetical protein
MQLSSEGEGALREGTGHAQTWQLWSVRAQGREGDLGSESEKPVSGGS